MGARTKLDRGVIKRGIITPDKHFPYHDEAAINVVTKAIKITKPDFYVDLGDTGEFESVSNISGNISVGHLSSINYLGFTKTLKPLMREWIILMKPLIRLR